MLSSLSVPVTVSLSILEKHLLRLGFALRDHCDARSGLVTTVATAPDGPNTGKLRYPKPTYLFHGRDRAADTMALLADMALLLCRPPSVLAQQALAGLGVSPPGFACVQCGRCCTGNRDAFQGRVSPEEVEAWAALNLFRILRLVDRVDRPGPHGQPGYSFYRAWIDPHTGRAYRSCPWLRSLPDGRFVCRIQGHKPLKCRAFPLNPAHADHIGCRGQDLAAPPQDAVYIPTAPI